MKVNDIIRSLRESPHEIDILRAKGNILLSHRPSSFVFSSDARFIADGNGGFYPNHIDRLRLRYAIWRWRRSR